MSTPSTRLADLRKSYERAELSEDASYADPLKQFDKWLGEAIGAEVPEQRLVLKKSQAYESGLVQLCYERAEG